MDHTPEQDGIEDFLGKPVPPADGLRQALLVQTTRVIRRRRRVRQIGLVVALAACYAAGLLTMRLVLPGTNHPKMAQETPPPVEKQPAPAPVVERSAKQDQVPPLTLEWQAVDSRVKRPDLFRRAGDRYFEEDGDLQSALRCYRSALDGASEQDLTISAEDNWLLMALKEAKQREKRHAKSEG